MDFSIIKYAIVSSMPGSKSWCFVIAEDAQFFDLSEVPEQVDADEHGDDGQLLDYPAEQVHEERPKDLEDTQHT
ncbi:hypothetical protein BU23DRAFT_219599 [Bimuria novae-zelandiae CBS 107.79]|uniref:Uncharacterized protein n=1 Tax=Bimuria novae-zelandiae CBS 107.79 TaxID=1447943 RepID=A0A6A5V4N1_9PLEO|nr:hypothetical protein BU23DRAFT_219599 [Bimuria novae-zelandiae CBS 107.79]